MLGPEISASSRSNEQPTFLNFDERYPTQIFTVVIWGSDRPKFGSLEQTLLSKRFVPGAELKSIEESPKSLRVRRYGAAVVVMAFDEKGQADTLQRKIEICERAYKILTEQVGIPAEDIIFDPNIFAIATGIEEHNNYGVDFIEATREIKARILSVAKLVQRANPIGWPACA